MGLGWRENDEKEKKRVRLRMELSGGGAREWKSGWWAEGEGGPDGWRLG